MKALASLAFRFAFQGISLEFFDLAMRLIAVFSKGVRVMTSLSFIECCRLFAIDPKTLRQWLAQAEMPLHPHSVDARIKCLSREQVQMLARLYDRTLPFPETGLSSVKTEDRQILAGLLDPLQNRLAQLEAQVATLQTQLTDLTLQLLREREQHTEERLRTLEAERGFGGRDDQVLSEGTSTMASQVVLPSFVRHATEKPLVPLIEYGARGRYVLISPEEGELPIMPDSPGWFDWLASLSSFRFVGRSGRFSARRGYNRGPNRCWYAQRGIHQKNYSKYIGVSEHVTIERLEQTAVHLQSYLK